MNHLKLYTEIRSGRHTNPKRDDSALCDKEYTQLADRAFKAESAERDAWAKYRSVEVEVRTALLDAEYLNSPQAEGRYTILERTRYEAEHKASTASGRARAARLAEMTAKHDRDCFWAAADFYEGTPEPLSLKVRYARAAA